jgi:hypothetical protein
MAACRVVAYRVEMNNVKSVRLRQGYVATAPKAFGAGGKGIRTPGLLIANETLYQLSYTPLTLFRARDYHVNSEFHPNCDPTRFAPLKIFGESISVCKSHTSCL